MESKYPRLRNKVLRMLRTRFSSLLPVLAILGSVTFLGLGTSWAKHSLFPEIGAQGTTALRLGFAAALMLLLDRKSVV